MGHLPKTQTQLYSEKVTGHPINWYPNGISLSSLIIGDTGIFTYGIKPDNAPPEKISEKAFGYGTLQIIQGRGDEGYGYGYAIYSGSLSNVRQVFAVYEKGTGWVEYAAKSSLFATGLIIDPNNIEVPFAIVNGWDSKVVNIPDDVKGHWCETATIWVYPSEIGNLSAARFQKIVADNGVMHARKFENNTWKDWS